MLKKTSFLLVVFLISIQFISIDKTNPKIDRTIALNSDVEVMEILKKSCYDCHSNETKHTIYSDIAPLSFGISSHISNGRKALNFSNYETIDKEIKIARLQRAITTVKNGMMPLPSYLMFHDEAQMNSSERKILLEWFERELEQCMNTP
ncbi:MAG: heme-binding domain-containing protein [Campylobacterota bacterium]|nr:heme-binding domain-containing protein [Campylobacterota bacterium]